MNQKIFIDIESNNEYINLIANYLYSNLQQKGYDVTILDNNLDINDKIDIINNEPKETIVVSNQINFSNETGSEIIYSLKDTNQLANSIENSLGNYTTISKFYQLRLPSDTALDYYQIIRETPNAETIIISYNESDLQEMQNDWQDIGQALTDGLIDYITGKNIYVVASGDSLYSIARKFGVTVQEIVDANNLGSTSLSIGQELIIPDKTTTPSIPEVPETPSANTYTVQSGDSLYSVARRFNTTVDTIKSLNNLINNNLTIGKVLVLPTTSNDTISTSTYTVQSGDSLYSIARRFNTTVDAIKNLNNLTSINLSIGQVLNIPSTSQNPSTTTYTVQSGDSLYSIARRFKTTVDTIKNLNNLTSNNLSIDQVLNIPN